jgi:hypothetical protein
MSFSKTIELGPIEPAKQYTCDHHVDEFLTMFCNTCARPICCKCINLARHTNHNVQSLQTTVKIHKVSYTFACFVVIAVGC